MALPKFPASIKHTLHYYLYVPNPTGGLSMFDTKLRGDTPDWIYLFSREVEVPVPSDIEATAYQAITPHFKAAIQAIQAEAGAKVNALCEAQSKFLALEN